jgi:hypothetical protein
VFEKGAHVSLPLRDMGILTSLSGGMRRRPAASSRRDIYSIFFLLFPLKSSFLKVCGRVYWGRYPQNIGSKELASKILRNKDLVTEMEPSCGHAVVNQSE